jgi:hypothetical protein
VASQTLFTNETPGILNAAEGVPVTVATTVTFAEDGTLDGIQIYGPSTISGTFSGAAWEVTADDSPADSGTGTLIGTVAMPSPVPGFQEFLFSPSPFPVQAGKAYRIGLRTSEGRYAATSGGFSAAGMTTGDISAPQTGTTVPGVGTIANGTFGAGTSNYPASTFSGGKYFVGPVYTAASDIPPEEHTSTGTAAATLAASATIATRRATIGTAALESTARAAVATRRVSTGTGTLAAAAGASIVTRRPTTGTGSLVVTAGQYIAGGAPGPWLTSRRRQPRIVTSTQVAR